MTSNRKTIRIGQIGAGRMGTLRARNATANARFQLALIADQHAPSAKRLAAETGAEIGTVDTMLDDPTIAGIIVVSSTDAHLDHARAALTVGKAVFCDKPIDLSLERLDAAAPSFAQPGLPPLFVAFNRDRKSVV